LPAGAAKDLERIVKASLHAREVIHKLLVFSRQKPLVKVQVNLNRVVSDGLYFLESRCARAGITLCRMLAPDLPEIPADASQLHQVVGQFSGEQHTGHAGRRHTHDRDTGRHGLGFAQRSGYGSRHDR